MDQLMMPPTTPVPFDGIMIFIWIGIFLMIGMLLRSTVPVFRRYLIPACIIGGTIGFFCQSFGLIQMSGFGVNNQLFQIVVYHLFNLTWVFLGLKIPIPVEGGSKAASKTVLWFTFLFLIFFSGAITVSTGVSTLTNYLGLSSGPDSLGVLTAAGFVQGPGQVLTIAKVWEGASTFGGLSDFAMASASMGFAIAVVVGVFMMNIIARKKGIEMLNNPSPAESCGYYDECDEISEAGKITTSPSNIDVFAWHIALGLGAYFLSLIFSVFMLTVLPPSLKPFVWTIFFITCCLSGILVRIFLVKIGKKRLLCNGVNGRISNTLVDFLVCGTFISIRVGNVTQYLWPFIISAIVVTSLVAFLAWHYCCKLKNEGIETFAFVFGSFAGTVATGFVLLRMVDPGGKSQVPIFMALCNVFTTPCLVLLTMFIHMEVVYKMSVGYLLGASIVMTIISAIALRILQPPKTKHAWQAD